APERLGAVLSMLRWSTEAWVVLPALSRAVPATDWSGPSPSVVAPVQLSRPDSASWHSKLTVTSALYQPLPLAARSGLPLIVGGVLSTLTDAVSDAVLPAWSAAEPLTSWSAPSLETVWGHVQRRMPESVSLQVNVTATSALFQRWLLGSGERECPIVGAVLSILTVAWLAASTLPALSTLQKAMSWWTSVERWTVARAGVGPP